VRNKILVDIDGTITSLGDYVIVFDDIVKRVAMKMGVDIGKWDMCKVYNSFLASGYVNSEKNLRMAGLDPDRFWAEVTKEDCEEREKRYGKSIRLYDDVSVLRKMSSNGFDFGIITDQPHRDALKAGFPWRGASDEKAACNKGGLCHGRRF